MEVAGIVPTPILLWLLRSSFSQRSIWLGEVAYRQAARLKEMPKDVAAYIRYALCNLMFSGRLRRERHAIYAHLQRLPHSSDFISVARFLLWIPFVNFVLHIFAIVLLLLSTWNTSLASIGLFLAAVLVIFYTLRKFSERYEQLAAFRAVLPILFFSWCVASATRITS